MARSKQSGSGKKEHDYISKPPDLNRLLITIRNAMDKTSLVAEAKVLKRKVSRMQEMVGAMEPDPENKRYD